MRSQWKRSLRYEPCIWHMMSLKNGASKIESMEADNVLIMDEALISMTTFAELLKYKAQRSNVTVVS